MPHRRDGLMGLILYMDGLGVMDLWVAWVEGCKEMLVRKSLVAIFVNGASE